jgi:hypothetical protein
MNDGCKPEGSEPTKIEQILRGLQSAEEERRNFIKLIVDKVSILLPIQPHPTCADKLNPNPKQTCIMTDILNKVNNLHEDNETLRDILSILNNIF